METSKDNCILTNSIQAEVFKEQLPPLENPVVVDIVAYQICHTGTIDDIKNFRMVNKLWKSAIRDPWKSRFRIHRIYPNPNSADPRTLEDEEAITLTQLWDQPDTNAIGKGSIALQSWKIEENHFLVPTLNQIQPGLNNWFWTEFGSNLSSLALIDCDSLGTFTIYSETFLKALPNLKTLRVINGEISAEGWEAITQRYCNKREFFEHFNLRNVYLDIVASDRQFDLFWGGFQRSLPKLEHVSVKILNRSRASYKWASPILRYREGKGNLISLSLSEFREGSKEELYHVKISQLTVEGLPLKIHWRVSQCSFEENVSVFPIISFLGSLIAELHLLGQVFRNLCFLKQLRDLTVLIWNGNESNEDNKINLTSLDNITTYHCRTLNSFPSKLKTVFIHSSIIVGDCKCQTVKTPNEIKWIEFFKSYCETQLDIARNLGFYDAGGFILPRGSRN